MSSLGRCLVTGAGGFLGRHLVRRLARDGHEVRALDVAFPSGWPTALGDEGTPVDAAALDRIERLTADVRDADAVTRAMEGVETVFHVAAVINGCTRAPSRERDRVFGINVEGTRHVVAAAAAGSPTRLVHTSSINVVFDRTPAPAVDESAPYASTEPLDLYTASKAEGERIALAVSPERLRACALRPGGIYGPGEQTHLPRIVREVLAGKLVARVGPGTAKADNVYVDDLVEAHVRAAGRLEPGSPTVGQAYQISDGHPIPYLEFFRPVIEALGHRVPDAVIPISVMHLVAGLGERVYALGGPFPIITTMEVRKLEMDNFSSIERARRELDWAPTVAPEEGMNRALPHAQALAAAHVPVVAPPLTWRIFVAVGLGLTFVLALSATAYGAWAGVVGEVIPRPVIQWIAAIAAALHVGEAVVAWRWASAAGLATAGAWAWQTLLFGFPSLMALNAGLKRRAD